MASSDAESPVNREDDSPANPEDMLGDVADLARLESTDAAERATLATLRTLGEHVTAGEAADLAAGLPDGLAAAVTDASDESPAAFSVDAFVERVAEREGLDDQAEAMRHVRAVFAGLADSGLEGELVEAREQLPNEYAALFEREGLATDAG